MAHLVDSPLLLRLANTADAQYPVAQHAIYTLHGQGETIHVAPQNLVEFRNSATRPVAVNGFGFPPAVVEAKATIFEATFSLLPETPDIYPAWETLVQAAGVVGKQVHDARLVALCHVYGPGLVVVNPNSV